MDRHFSQDGAREAIDPHSPLTEILAREAGHTSPESGWTLAAAQKRFTRESERAALLVLARRDGRSYKDIGASLKNPLGRAAIAKAVKKLGQMFSVPTRRPGKSAALAEGARRGWEKRRKKAPAAEATEASLQTKTIVNPEAPR